MIFQLAYQSTAVRDFPEAELRGLLAQSLAKNARLEARLSPPFPAMCAAFFSPSASAASERVPA